MTAPARHLRRATRGGRVPGLWATAPVITVEQLNRALELHAEWSTQNTAPSTSTGAKP